MRNTTAFGEKMKLTEYRNALDGLDEKIVALLDERFELSERIGQYKKENSLPVYDAEREEALIGRIRDMSQRPDGCEAVYRAILDESKKIQSKE